MPSDPFTWAAQFAHLPEVDARQRALEGDFYWLPEQIHRTGVPHLPAKVT